MVQDYFGRISVMYYRQRFMSFPQSPFQILVASAFDTAEIEKYKERVISK
jgi:hypothetical protein